MAARASSKPKAAAVRLGAGRLLDYLVFGLFALLSVVALYPIVWLITNSFKTSEQMFDRTWALPTVWHWENYAKAWSFGIQNYLANSLIVTSLSVILVVAIGSMAAYALSRFDFRFKNPLFYLILGGMMLAPEVALFPLFRILRALHIYDTHWGLILPYVAFGLPFTTFLIRAYMLGIPREIEEAAEIDGSSPLHTFWYVILPLCRPILASAALLQTMRVWNEFMFALTFIESEKTKTLTVGVMSLANALRTDWAVLMAGLVLSALPIVGVFLLVQRQFVAGLTQGSVK